MNLKMNKQAIKEVLTHRFAGAIIGMFIAGMYGVPLMANLKISITVGVINFLKDYYIKKLKEKYKDEEHVSTKKKA